MRELESSREECPHCSAQLQGDPIPEDQQHWFGATHFSRKIGLTDRERDRTTAWRCPDCGETWAR